MLQGDLLKQIQEKTTSVIIDVRSQGEYDADHLPGAVHIPFYSIGSGVQKRNYSKQERIVLYCDHGPRAGMAAFSLYLHGYGAVYSLDGHMQRWRANALPVEKAPH